METSQPPAHTGLDPDYLLTLGQFLGLLPGVPPLDAATALQRHWLEMATVGADHFEIGGVRVGLAESAELFVERDSGAPCVTPAGARLLIALYRQGALPLRTSRPQSVPLLASAYAAASSELAEMPRACATARVAHLKAAIEFDRKVADYASCPEAEFTFGLLDAIFRQHKGPGAASMRIGGILVTKSIARPARNSGENPDYAVEFNWNSRVAASPRQLGNVSQFEGNRRNDAARDWGLPG